MTIPRHISDSNFSSPSSLSSWSSCSGQLAITMLRGYLWARFPGLDPRRSRPYGGSAVHLSIGVHRFNHPFIRPHVHAPVFLTKRAGPLGPSLRTGPALAALYRVRGVADLTEGVVAPVRLGPLSSHHVFLSFSILLLISFACARERSQTYPPVNVLLPPSRCVTAALPPFSLSSPLSSSFSYYYSLSSIPLPTPPPPPPFLPSSSRPHPGLLRSYPTYCPFRSNLGCVAGSKRNYSYLPPTLSDSRLFRGSSPIPSSSPSLALPPLLFSPCVSSFSSIFDCVIKLFQLRRREASIVRIIRCYE